jgi:hypothetical protein
VLTVKGRLHSKGDLPFESEGSLSATDDGEIRIHIQRIKAAHLPVKGIMDLLGVKIANLISTKKVRGIRVDGDDVLIDVEQILPPPRIEGYLARFPGTEDALDRWLAARATIWHTAEPGCGSAS